MRRKTSHLRRWALLPAGLALCLIPVLWVVGMACFRPWCDRLLAAYCEDGLAGANEEQAAASLARLMTLRKPGIAAVIRAMGHSVPMVRELAYQTLSHELNRCDSAVPSTAAAARFVDLLQAMSDHIDPLPDDARQRLAGLAMRMLAHSEALPLAERNAAIAACQHVLDAAAVRPAASGPGANTAFAKQTIAAPASAGRNSSAQTTVHPPSTARLDLAQLSAPPLPRADAPGERVYAQPAVFAARDAVALVEKPQQPTAASPQVRIAGYAAEVDGARAEDAAADTARRETRELDLIGLFTRLHESQPRAFSARAELEARGYSPRQIEVGGHLASPHAEERLRWTEWLPGIRGIDARFWLLRLSHDPNVQVRRAAVGLLATDRDPEVIRRLQRIVVEETDARIRDQAQRTLEAFGEP